MPKKKTSSNNECRYIVRSDKTSRLAIAMSWIWFFVQITFRRAPVNYFNHAGWFESKPPRKIQAAYRAPTTAADNTQLQVCFVSSTQIQLLWSKVVWIFIFEHGFCLFTFLSLTFLLLTDTATFCIRIRISSLWLSNVKSIYWKQLKHTLILKNKNNSPLTTQKRKILFIVFFRYR